MTQVLMLPKTYVQVHILLMRNYQTSFITVFSLNKQMKRKEKKKVDNDEICRFLAVVQFDLSCFGFNCAGNLICNTTGGINCSECPHGYYPTGSNIENQTKCSNFRKALIFGKRSRGKFIAIGTCTPFYFVLCLDYCALINIILKLQ